jgi:hypothetical protein
VDDAGRGFLHGYSRALGVGFDNAQIVDHYSDAFNLSRIADGGDTLLVADDIAGKGNHVIGGQDLDSGHLHADIAAKPVLYLGSDLRAGSSAGASIRRQGQQ